jgi:hypothetical protein
MGGGSDKPSYKKKLFVHFTLICKCAKNHASFETTVFKKVTSHTDVSEVPTVSQFSFEEDIFIIRGIISVS